MERRIVTLEDDRRDFQTALNSAGTKLTVAALILAAAQVLTMTPDSVLYKLAVSIISLVWEMPPGDPTDGAV